MSRISEAVDICEKLNSSITFCMSQSGKEIFHSNFIAYILEKNSAPGSLAHDFKKNFLKIIFGEDIDPDEYKVCAYRELSNIDLIVTIENKYTIKCAAIEFKLKSIPTKSQLENYTIKLDNKIRLNKIENHPGKQCVTVKKLISPIPLPDMPEGWGHIDFSKITEFYEPSTGTCNTLNDLVTQDYIKSTAQILEAISFIKSELNEFTSKYSQIRINEIDQFSATFSAARIHDLSGKLIYSLIVAELKRLLDKSLNINEGKAPKGLSDEMKIKYETHFSNSMPGLTIRLISNKNGTSKSVGAQLQNGEIRRFIESLDRNRPLNEILNKGNQLKGWIDAAGYLGKKQDTDEYLNFDIKKFIYKRKEITSKNFTFNEIYEEFKISLQEILKILEDPSLSLDTLIPNS